MEPIKLKVRDFYSLSNGEVDFTRFSSSLILGYYENNPLMSNGAGKSSIFEAIYWVVFNKTRQKKVDDVIRWSANETFVEFEFAFGRSTYKISRRRSRVAKESSVSLFTKEGDKWVNDSGSTNSETDKKIFALLKIDDKIFLNSVYFKQDDISLFANANPSERKEIIKSIMKLERWDKYQKQASDKAKGVKVDIEKQLRVINENNNAGVIQIVNERAIEDVHKALLVLTKQQKDIQNVLHNLLELKRERNLSNLIKTLDDTVKKTVELKASGKKLQGRQLQINELLESNNEKSAHTQWALISLESSLANINEQIESLKKENNSYQELEDDILTCRVDKSKLESTIDGLNDTSSMVGVGQCQLCLIEITESSLPHIHKNRQEKKEQASSELITAKNKLEKIEAEYKTRKAAKEKLDLLSQEAESHKTDLIKSKMQKQSVDDERFALTNESSMIDVSIRSIVDQLKSFKIEVEALEQKIAEQKINNVDNEISDVEEKNKNILNEITNKNIELGTLLKEKEFLTQKVALVTIATEQLVKLGKEKTSCDQLVRFFGKEGIQAVFIESVVDELEQYANATLSYICNEPTVIKLKTQKRTGDSWQETLEIDVVMNGYPQTFESLGGGERFRISLALRIGLSEVLVKRAGGEIKLLLLDEVDSPLDTYGLNNLFENIVKGLEKRFKILVISHNDKLKDRFADVITVNKTSNGSFITQV